MTEERAMEADVVREALEKFFANARRPVLFSGAGVSARAGIPSWSGLIEKLASSTQSHDPLTKQQMHECVKNKDYTRAVDYFELSNVPEGDKRKILKSVLSSYDPTPLKGIAKLPFNTCLTTNFDRSLHDAIASERGTSPLDFRYGDASFREAIWEESLLVARIHGAVEHPDSIVLSNSKFKILLADPNYRELLSNFFTQRDVLFIGFSFYDPAIKHIFEELDRIHGPSTPGRHLALLPSDAESDFFSKASRLNITTLKYNGADHHKVLWDAIDMFGTNPTVKVNKPIDPLFSTKRYLAACYARAKTTGYTRALRESVSEAVVAAILQEVSPSPSTKGDLFEKLRSVIGLKRKDSEDLVDRALVTLMDAGLVRKLKSTRITSYVWHDQNKTEDSLGTDIDHLCEGICARAKLQESWTLNDLSKSRLPDIFDHLVRNRGWDLGVAFAAGRTPEPVEVTALLAAPKLNLPAYDQERLAKIITSLLQSPTEREAKILSNMGRAAFALELAFQTPRSVFLHEAILPQRIYLDASVLLPAIVPGHPFAETYSNAIQRLREAASSAGVDLRIRVTTPYLNEIISHRSNAQTFARESGANVGELATRDARYAGAENTNVYVGAYAVYVEINGPTDFADFLRRVAPYTKESELKTYLEKRKYEVIRPAMNARYSSIYSQLERDYAGGLSRGKKTPVLIEHDALQLSMLQEDLLQGHRSILVSADRQLRQFVGAGPFSGLTDSMMSHVGLIQFIELMLGGVPEDSNLTKLLWSTRQSDQLTNIRNYYVNLAMNAYDAAMLLAMPKILEELTTESDRELTRLNESLESTDPRAKVRAYKVLRSFEENFFQKMNAEVTKIERRLEE
jgi:hypothetical protein